jgi:hypothetical protein
MLLTDFRELPPRPDLAPLMKRFESLGVSCELGLVQRHCHFERPGLFRFGYTPIGGLIAALNAGFEGIGNPAEITVQEQVGKEWITAHQRYGFEFHTQITADTHKADEVREIMSGHFSLLARKLLEDIEDGEKIFVFRPATPGPPSVDGIKLLAALHRYGNPILLWIDLAKESHQIGTVEWIIPGRLMTGYLDRYALVRFAAGGPFGIWLQVLDAARRLADQATMPVRAARPQWSALVHDPVVQAETVHVRRHGRPNLQLMLNADHAIQFLPPGWTGVALYTGLEPFLLLELQHPEWGRATWYFNADGQKIGDHVVDLVAQYHGQLRRAVSALFSGPADPAVTTQSVGFSVLNAVSQRELMALLTG